MGEFFKGWRRKLGVATLGLACVFAALWIRGMTTNDEFDSYRWVQTSRRLLIENGEYATQILHSGPETPPVIWPNAIRGRIMLDRWTAFKVDIPHWSIVLPLTLLSAFLLLSKPRKREPQVSKVASEKGRTGTDSLTQCHSFFKGWRLILKAALVLVILAAMGWDYWSMAALSAWLILDTPKLPAESPRRH